MASPSVTASLSPIRQRLYGLLTVGIVSACLLGQSSFQIERHRSHVQRGVSAKQPHIDQDAPSDSQDSIQFTDDSLKDRRQVRRNSRKQSTNSSANVKSLLAAKQADQYSIAFPPLDSLVLSSNATWDQFPRQPTPFASDEHLIIGDVRQLLDFAILGHAKTATSYLMKWLHTHPDVQIWPDEVCDLVNLRPAELTRKLYLELPHNTPNQTYQRGFKCPGRFSRASLRYFQDYFTDTRLIVGVRHPGKME